jgi:hypothetical protein
VQIVRRKEIVRYKQKRILDLNKDKDNYGKNSRGRYPKKQERCYSTYYIFGLGKVELLRF